MTRKKYIMYVDETGTSQSEHTPFTLLGVIFEYKYAMDNEHTNTPSPLKNELSDFKNMCFRNPNIPLHLREILEGTAPYDVSNNIQPSDFGTFWNNLPKFLNGLKFSIISVTVDKQKLNKFYTTPKDAYVVAFAHIMKSLYSFMSRPTVESMRIVLESRGEKENFMMQKAFFDIYNSGTVHLDIQSNIKEKIMSFIFANKNDTKHQCGLEIADLLCLPINRARRGLVEIQNPAHYTYGSRNRILAHVKSKFYEPNNDAQELRNWGFKMVPVVKKNRQWRNDPR